MTRQYPYEIESDEGGVWIYSTNSCGNFFDRAGSLADHAGPTCDEIMREIDAERGIWSKGSCVYRGPMRTRLA